MSTYQSSFSGPEIDSSVAKSQTALQPGDVSGGGGVTEYPTVAELPMSGVEQGTLALVKQTLQGDSAVFIWNGTPIAGGWYKLATVNLAPTIISGPEPEYVLPNDGAPVTLNLVAEDPEGLPISWSYVLAEGALDGFGVVTQDGSNFTVAADPAAVSAQSGGAFSLTFKADDGVSVAGATAEFTLTFALPTRFLVVGAGTGYYLGTYDLEQDPAPLADATINSTIRGIAWVNRDLVVVSTASNSQNPQFATVRESDGLLERVFENELAGIQGRGTSGVSASADGLWCAVVLVGAPYVAFYSVSGGVPTRVLPFGSVPSAWSVEFNPTGDFCVVTDTDGAVHVFDLRSGTPTPTQYPGLGANPVLHPQFSIDGTKLYFADNGRTDSKLVVADFDPATGAISNATPLGAVTDNVQDLHVSPDGELLCVGGPNTPIFDIGVDPVNPPLVVLGGVSYRSADDREFIFSPDMKLAALRVQAPSSARIRVFEYDAETRVLTERSLGSEEFVFPTAIAFQPGSV